MCPKSVLELFSDVSLTSSSLQKLASGSAARGSQYHCTVKVQEPPALKHMQLTADLKCLPRLLVSPRDHLIPLEAIHSSSSSSSSILHLHNLVI
jgi:hypothetical protein